MEDTQEDQKYEYLSLSRRDIPDHLKKNNYNQEIIQILMKDYLNKNPKINLLRLRFGKPMGIDSWITNDIQYCIKRNLKSLCEYIWIKDSTQEFRG